MAKRRGTAVSLLPCRTARGTDSVIPNCVWMFSTSTVASSTRMPTASARPPRVIKLMVWPLSHSATTAPSNANGMLSTTTRTLRQSRKNTNTIRPVSAAPSMPSLATPSIARET